MGADETARIKIAEVTTCNTAPIPTHRSEGHVVQIQRRIPVAPRWPVASLAPHRVSIHHPAYTSSRLLDISAFDTQSGDIHYGTALLICGIIAGNKWEGWFTEEKTGPKLVLDRDAVLMRKRYYYHLPHPSTAAGEDGGPYKYPVVPSFQH